MRVVESDGATLPKPVRRTIEWLYPTWVIEAIDDSGITHDWDTQKDKNVWVARQRFNINLYRYGICKRPDLAILRRVIVGGLFVYDITPNFIKKLLKGSAEGKRTLQEVPTHRRRLKSMNRMDGISKRRNS